MSDGLNTELNRTRGEFLEFTPENAHVLRLKLEQLAHSAMTLTPKVRLRAFFSKFNARISLCFLLPVSEEMKLPYCFYLFFSLLLVIFVSLKHQLLNKLSFFLYFLLTASNKISIHKKKLLHTYYLFNLCGKIFVRALFFITV